VSNQSNVAKTIAAISSPLIQQNKNGGIVNIHLWIRARMKDYVGVDLTVRNSRALDQSLGVTASSATGVIHEGNNTELKRLKLDIVMRRLAA